MLLPMLHMPLDEKSCQQKIFITAFKGRGPEAECKQPEAMGVQQPAP